MIQAPSHTRRQLLALVGAVPVLGACNIVPEVNKPLNLYSLSPKVTEIASPPPTDWQLVVATPAAGADLGTNRIALSRAANRIEYFAEGVWADAAPALVQAKLIEAFETAVPTLAVGRDSTGLKPDFILQSDLRDFQAVYSGANAEVSVKIAARLVKMPERRIMGTITAQARQPSGGGGLPGVVAAFEAALGNVFGELIPGVLAAANS
jgi:cholesterol transport system auxiliary component